MLTPTEEDFKTVFRSNCVDKVLKRCQDAWQQVCVKKNLFVSLYIIIYLIIIIISVFF